MPITMMRTPKISIPLPTTRMAGSITDSRVKAVAWSMSVPPATHAYRPPSPAAPASCRSRAVDLSLLCVNARRDGRNHVRSHFELVPAVFDSVSPRNPVEVGIGHPDLALLVLEDEKPHRPIEPGIGVGGDELRAEGRIAEDQKYRGLQLDARIGRESGLVDLVEELDAFVGDILLQALDRLSDRIGALHPHDTVSVGQRSDRRRCRQGTGKQQSQTD